jgi:hypothetical protein
VAGCSDPERCLTLRAFVPSATAEGYVSPVRPLGHTRSAGLPVVFSTSRSLITQRYGGVQRTPPEPCWTKTNKTRTGPSVFLLSLSQSGGRAPGRTGPGARPLRLGCTSAVKTTSSGSVARLSRSEGTARLRPSVRAASRWCAARRPDPTRARDSSDHRRRPARPSPQEAGKARGRS